MQPNEGCTKSQVDQIIALVQATMSEGVPEMKDLERILKSIGGLVDECA